MKKILSSLFLATLLTACGYAPDNVRVADIYEGKKIQLLNKLTPEDRDLLNKYIARKTVTVQKISGNKVVFDSSTLGLAEFNGNGGLTVGNENSNVKIDGNNITAQNSVVMINDNTMFTAVMDSNGQQVITKIIRPNTENAKEFFGDVTVEQAIEEQKLFDKKWEEHLAKIKKNEEEYNKQQELSKMIRIGLVEKVQLEDNNLGLMFTFTNRYPKSVIAFRGIVEFYNPENEKFYRVLVTEGTGVKAKGANIFDGEFKIDMSKPDEKMLWDIPEEQIKLKFVVTDILFEDGEVFGDDAFKDKSKIILKAIKDVTDSKEVAKIVEDIIYSKPAETVETSPKENVAPEAQSKDINAGNLDGVTLEIVTEVVQDLLQGSEKKE